MIPNIWKSVFISLNLFIFLKPNNKIWEKNILWFSFSILAHNLIANNRDQSKHEHNLNTNSKHIAHSTSGTTKWILTSKMSHKRYKLSLFWKSIIKKIKSQNKIVQNVFEQRLPLVFFWNKRSTCGFIQWDGHRTQNERDYWRTFQMWCKRTKIEVERTISPNELSLLFLIRWTKPMHCQKSFVRFVGQRQNLSMSCTWDHGWHNRDS